MGCDIHCHVEILIDNKWEHYTILRIPRYYALFAKMADVRNNDDLRITPIGKPRGLPSDMSTVTKFDFEIWQDNAHSLSWLTSKQVIELYAWLETTEDIIDRQAIYDRIGYLFGHYYKHFDKYRSEFPSGLQDFRWVFWFDN